MPRLDTYATVTLDAAGKGTAILTPPAFEIWHVDTINVRTSQAPTQTPIPQCTVYLGSVHDGSIVAQTWNGSRATATGFLQVQPSQPLLVVWENGIAGTSATVSINGTTNMR